MISVRDNAATNLSTSTDTFSAKSLLVVIKIAVPITRITKVTSSTVLPPVTLPKTALARNGASKVIKTKQIRY